MTERDRIVRVARVRLLIIVIIVGGLSVSVRWLTITPAQGSAESISAAREAFAGGHYATAERLAAGLLQERPQTTEAALLAARAAVARERLREAIDYLEQVPDNGQDAVTARCAEGDLLLLSFCSLSDAESQFRRALELEPDNVKALDRLAYLLGLSSRQWEQTAPRLELIRLNQSSPMHLLLLGLSETALENPEEIERCLQMSPTDPLVQLGAARIDVEEQNPKAARQRLESVVRQEPGLVEAQVRLGRLLLTSQDTTGFLRWHNDLGQAADSHPEVWTLRGDFARTRKNDEVAARCYWEAVRRDPNRQHANYQLGQTLIRMGQLEQAAPFLNRANLLEQYVNSVKDAYTDPTQVKLQRVVDLAESAGLVWEALGWSQESFRKSRPQWAAERIETLRPRLATLPLTRAVPDVNPAETLDLSDYPGPRWRNPDAIRSTTERASESSHSLVRFESVSAQLGIGFQYYNGGNPDLGLKHMYEFTGSGVAVLDFDVDGWPDLYLPQGSQWPVQRAQREYLDRLHRNNRGTSFVDVSAAACLVESGFSQGSTVGDFNDDGFPDIYVGNAGANTLFRNNGDGTFTEVTNDSGTAGDDWTTSCAFADLNGDSFPDLYCVNYLSGDDVFERVCDDGRGARLCMPQTFAAAQDRIYLNSADGTFRDITDESGIQVSNGKGLGLVVTDFDGSGSLGIFVANDSVANFYFVPDQIPASPSVKTFPNRTPSFKDMALATGLALNAEGRSEACMGIAAGDIDHDGLTELFVTNFLLESNTLYHQSATGLFSDCTAPAGLRQPSLSRLGFGTQFLDAELDGDADLIVVNGHINDHRSEGTLYRMKPQFFENQGEMTFREVPATQTGDYFATAALGRGMATLDWNRDGLMEAAISHLDAPLALLQNVTRNHGNRVSVELRGIASGRDAIGASVEITTAEGTLRSRLQAGDGYLASNQRQLIFGLGSATSIESISITWPSGLSDHFEDLPVNTSCLFVEGHGRFLH